MDKQCAGALAAGQLMLVQRVRHGESERHSVELPSLEGETDRLVLIGALLTVDRPDSPAAASQRRNESGVVSRKATDTANWWPRSLDTKPFHEVPEAGQRGREHAGGLAEPAEVGQLVRGLASLGVHVDREGDGVDELAANQACLGRVLDLALRSSEP